MTAARCESVSVGSAAASRGFLGAPQAGLGAVEFRELLGVLLRLGLLGVLLRLEVGERLLDVVDILGAELLQQRLALTLEALRQPRRVAFRRFRGCGRRR